MTQHKYSDVAVERKREFASKVDNEIVLSTAVVPIAIEDIVVANLPDQITVVDARLTLLIGVLVDISGIANAINGATQYIQLKKSGGSFINAIHLVDNELYLDALVAESRKIIHGTYNLKSQVDGNGTYECQFLNGTVDGDSLKLKDVQCLLEIWYE